MTKWGVVLVMAAALASPNSPALAQDQPGSFVFKSSAPEGLVGNGRSVVKVRPDGYEFFSGGSGRGRFELVLDGASTAFSARSSSSAEFFPGGVIYSLKVSGTEIDVLHGATAESPYFVAFRVQSGAARTVSVRVNSENEPLLSPSGEIPLSDDHGVWFGAVSPLELPDAITWNALKSNCESPYLAGFQIRTPLPALDRAARFAQFLLDLGFDGNIHVSELFRWRDIWSRDLGTGLAPGALIGGRFAAARSSIRYDLKRYRSANPRGLRITEDASQGGSAEGLSWLTRAVWRDFRLTGDSEFLTDAAATLRPWVEAWIDRDADEDGLIVDVTEWMDHSRFFLFPDGSRVLYSNALFADLLRAFSDIERELGNESAARRLREIRERSIHAINTQLWNDRAGAYDNLVLWGRRDERLSSAENALAILAGVAPPDRTARALKAIRDRNWRKAGSVTISPAMTHVDDRNDQNVRVWPWWNSVEARARLRYGDPAGGLTLLEKCAATLEVPNYPGLIEELLTPEGVSEGGHAFLSAAGSFLDAICEGLLGVEILESGCRRIRVSPNVPDWKSWEATVPLPQGEIAIAAVDGSLRIRVTDPRVQVVEAPPGAVVEGAEGVEMSPAQEASPSGDFKSPSPVQPPPLSARSAVFFAEDGIPSSALSGLPAGRVNAEQLISLDPAIVQAVVIAGNALPRHTRKGQDVAAALAAFLDKGGAIVFYGATMHDRGTMGEQGGVIDWYEWRPVLKTDPIEGWIFRISPDPKETPREKEHGFVHGWQSENADDHDWKSIRVPGWWEDHLGGARDGWGWYRARFTLPASAKGRAVVLDLGRIDDDDWTYVNGVFVGADKGWQTRRMYRINPGSPAYATLRFGGVNVIAIQVFVGGGGGGMHADPTRVAFETQKSSWQAINAKTGAVSDQPVRHGVISWGPGGNFFNSWETSRGAFGFKVEGQGVKFDPRGPLADLADMNIAVKEAFTDFAVSKPWRFEPLAFTETRRRLLVPDGGERYPCAARITNAGTRGEFILIPMSLAQMPIGPKILELLNVRNQNQK